MLYFDFLSLVLMVIKIKTSADYPWSLAIFPLFFSVICKGFSKVYIYLKKDREGKINDD